MMWCICFLHLTLKIWTLDVGSNFHAFYGTCNLWQTATGPRHEHMYPITSIYRILDKAIGAQVV
jgi:hypothetical protein